MKPCILVPLAVLAASPHVLAQQVDSGSPDKMVRGTVESVMSAVRSDPAARGGDAGRIYQIVQQRFLPHTDFRLTTQYALGNEAWAKATPAQRDALFHQFQTLLAHTYATQLTQTRGEDTRFKFPPMAPLPATATDAVVRTQVVSGGETMPVDYRVHKGPDGWKIYDINMMGAWMIVVYRQQFAAQMARGGIDGLIKYLAAHNEAGA
ncbi:MAG: MlaC/ttg2D family ABC transporter substrate-binding protein [Telluria sp.]